jgi:mRNA interferase RelE/StbE
VNGYVIELARAVENEVEKLPEMVRRRVAAVIDSLESNPRPRGALKLKGSESSYRIRVGQYRILYTIDDDSRIVQVIRVRHRKDAYQ